MYKLVNGIYRPKSPSLLVVPLLGQLPGAERLAREYWLLGGGGLARKFAMYGPKGHPGISLPGVWGYWLMAHGYADVAARAVFSVLR